MSIASEFREGLIGGYQELMNSLSPEYSPIIKVFVFAILISIYAIFCWKFYRFLSKKDLIELNLNQYNKTLHPGLSKLIATIFYIIEYILILPFIIFFWFLVLALLILLLSENLSVLGVIMASSAIVASVRILAYYEGDLSKDLAKIFPFTALTIFLLSPNFFSFERIYLSLGEIPSLLGQIIYFIILIIVIELVLRLVDLTLGLWGIEEKTD
jgi:hypothetical protein